MTANETPGLSPTIGPWTIAIQKHHAGKHDSFGNRLDPAGGTPNPVPDMIEHKYRQGMMSGKLHARTETLPKTIQYPSQALNSEPRESFQYRGEHPPGQQGQALRGMRVL